MSLGGCSSFSSFSLDYFKPTPPSIQVQLESTPPGADAKTSVGPGCKTPCSVSVAAPDTGFSVAYTLDKFEPQTVQVKVIRNPGDVTSPASTVTDPNPVFAELQPAAPPAKAHKPIRPKKPRARSLWQRHLPTWPTRSERVARGSRACVADLRAPHKG